MSIGTSELPPPQVLPTDPFFGRNGLTREECEELFLDDLVAGILADCPFETFPLGNFTADNFTEIGVVRSMHATPRFGRTRDVVKFVHGSKREKAQYVNGIYTFSTVAWVLFLIWFIFLLYARLVLKAGFVSGYVMVNPHKDEANQEEEAVEEKQMEADTGQVLEQPRNADVAAVTMDTNLGNQERIGEEEQPGVGVKTETKVAMHLESQSLNEESRVSSKDEEASVVRRSELWTEFQRRLKFIRISVFASGISAWVWSILLLAYAFPEVNSVLATALFAMPPLIDGMEIARNSTLLYLNASRETDQARLELVNLLVDTCNFNRTLTFENETFTLGDIVVMLNTTLSNSTTVYDLADAVNKTFYNVTRSMENIYGGLDSMEEWWYYAAGAFVIVVDLVIFLFLVGTALSWTKPTRQPRRLRDTNNWVFLPVFCSSLLAAYVISCYSLIFSQFLGDFCITTPDLQVIRIIDAPWPLSNYINWYIGGCKDEDAPEFIFQLLDTVARSFLSVEDAVDVLRANGDSAILDEYCQQQGSLIWESTTLFLDRIGTLLALGGEMLNVFRCSNFNPVYTAIAYEMACQHGIRATTLTFSFLFLFALSCMIIVSLRVAWWTIKADNLEPKLATAYVEPIENKLANEPIIHKQS